jgi:heme/copper-type cytochrome/quinol oxidase subunit 3
MSPIGNGNPGQQNQQSNTANNGNIYATQTGNINFTTTPAAAAVQQGRRLDTKVLLVTLLTDVVFFLYGMAAYTGRNTTGDEWRAGIFLFLFVATCGMAGRWVRRRI